MDFIHYDSMDGNTLESSTELLIAQPFRCEEQDLDFAMLEVMQDCSVVQITGKQRCGFEAVSLTLMHQIPHKGDGRGDDQHCPGGMIISLRKEADGLPLSGPCQSNHIVTMVQVIDDSFLEGLQLVDAKEIAEVFVFLGVILHGGFPSWFLDVLAEKWICKNPTFSSPISLFSRKTIYELT